MDVSPVLVDSSYYICRMRQGRDPLRELALTAVTRDLAVCGVVRCEVGRAIRHRGALERFRAFWNAMIQVPTDSRLWQRVEETLWRLDRRGLVLPLPAVVIACCARSIGAAVLTTDSHFSHIPGLRVMNRARE